jgi:hypothetical protein
VPCPAFVGATLLDLPGEMLLVVTDHSLHTAFRLSRTSRQVRHALTTAASNTGLRFVAKDAYQALDAQASSGFNVGELMLHDALVAMTWQGWSRVWRHEAGALNLLVDNCRLLTSISLPPNVGRGEFPEKDYVKELLKLYRARWGWAKLILHGESGVKVFRRPKLLHEIVIPEDDTASVADRRPRMDQFLLPSMWRLPVSGPDSPIQGSAFEVSIFEDGDDDEDVSSLGSWHGSD